MQVLSDHTQKREAMSNSRSDVQRVAAIGALSGVLYLALFIAQKSLFFNGLGMGFGQLLPGGTPADRAHLNTQLAGYYAATAGVIALYGWLLMLCRRDRIQTRNARLLALAFPVLFAIVLLFGRPYASIDLLSYMAHGYLGTQPDGNPYLQPAALVGDMPFGQQLAEYGWIAVHPQSPYGPLWTQIEIGVLRLTQSVPVAMLLLKSVVLLASLATAAVIWFALGRLRPQDQLAGTVLYLWNPVLLIEFALEGHNDAVMILWVVMAIALSLLARPAWSVFAMGLGVLAKYLPLIFLPAQLLYLWRNRQSTKHVALSVALGAAVVAVVSAALFAPLWAGRATFDGVTGAGQLYESWSPSGLLVMMLGRSRPPESAAELAAQIIRIVFALVVLALSWRARDDKSLLDTCIAIALTYVLFASPGYWAWYVALSIALIALNPRSAWVWMALVLTLSSRVVAPISDLAANGFVDWVLAINIISGVGTTAPLVIGMLLLALFWRRSKPHENAESVPLQPSLDTGE